MHASPVNYFLTPGARVRAWHTCDGNAHENPPWFSSCRQGTKSGSPEIFTPSFDRDKAIKVRSYVWHEAVQYFNTRGNESQKSSAWWSDFTSISHLFLPSGTCIEYRHKKQLEQAKNHAPFGFPPVFLLSPHTIGVETTIRRSPSIRPWHAHAWC